MVGHTYLEFGRLRQEDCEFQVSVECIVRSCLKKQKQTKNIGTMRIENFPPSSVQSELIKKMRNLQN
jgi:hypothetical protein